MFTRIALVFFGLVMAAAGAQARAIPAADLIEFVKLPDPACALEISWSSTELDPLTADPQRSIKKMLADLRAKRFKGDYEHAELLLNLAKAYQVMDSTWQVEEHAGRALVMFERIGLRDPTAVCAYRISEALGLLDESDGKSKWLKRAVERDSLFFPAVYDALLDDANDYNSARWKLMSGQSADTSQVNLASLQQSYERIDRRTARFLGSDRPAAERAEVAYLFGDCESSLSFNRFMSGFPSLHDRFQAADSTAQDSLVTVYVLGMMRTICARGSLPYFRLACQLVPSNPTYQFRLVLGESLELIADIVEDAAVRDDMPDSLSAEQTLRVLFSGACGERLYELRDRFQELRRKYGDRFPVVNRWLGGVEAFAGHTQVAYRLTEQYLEQVPGSEVGRAQECALIALMAKDSSEFPDQRFLRYFSADDRECTRKPTAVRCYRCAFIKMFLLDQDTEARVALELAQREKPDDEHVRLGLAAVSLFLGDKQAFAQNVEALRSGPELFSEKLGAYLILESILAADQGRLSQAMEYARRAAKIEWASKNAAGLLAVLEQRAQE